MQKKTHIKKGDLVKVLAGVDRSKQGRVLDVDRVKMRATVEGLNINKKHSKPTTATPQGGIVEKEMPLAVSKIAIWNPGVKKPDRIGFKTLTDGKKVRFFKSNGEMIDA